MPAEVIHYLSPQKGDLVIDCTLGGGGHLQALLQKIGSGGRVLGIDLDGAAIAAANENTKSYRNKVLVNDNFKNLKKIAAANNFSKVNGILLDLGLSSAQLADHNRGFSFLAQGKLDMRFGRQTELTAEKILNTFKEKDLTEIFKEFGEEKLARQIAGKIIAARKNKIINTPLQLVEIISEVYRRFYRGKSKINPATKIFQALRIAVNEELENLKVVLPQAVGLLAKGGKIAVISYHSLEDRTVKEFFRQENKDCICPPTMPACQCRHKKTLKIITPKPVEPSQQEVLENSRSRSAKLRVAQKI